MHSRSHTTVNPVTHGTGRTLPPYLTWAVAWFVFFLFAASVRVGTILWDPVFRWVFVQVTALEAAFGVSGRWSTFGLILATYLVIGCLLWLAVESLTRWRTGPTWVRSGMAWAALQVTAMIVIFFTS